MAHASVPVFRRCRVLACVGTPCEVQLRRPRSLTWVADRKDAHQRTAHPGTGRAMVDTHGGRHAGGGRTAAGDGSGRRWAGAVLVALVSPRPPVWPRLGRAPEPRPPALPAPCPSSRACPRAASSPSPRTRWASCGSPPRTGSTAATATPSPSTSPGRWTGEALRHLHQRRGRGRRGRPQWATYGGGLNRSTAARALHCSGRSGRALDPERRQRHRDPGGPARRTLGGTARGLNRFDAATGRWQRYRPQPDRPHSPRPGHGAGRRPRRQLWVGGRRWRGSRLDPSTGGSSKSSPAGRGGGRRRRPGAGALPRPRGALWLGTDGAAAWAGRPASGVTRYRHRPGRSGQPRPTRCVAILRDADGDLWLGTAGGLEPDGRGTAAPSAISATTPADSQSLANNGVRWPSARTRSACCGRAHWAAASTSSGSGRNSPPTRGRPTIRGRCAAVIFAFAEEADGALWVGDVRRRSAGPPGQAHGSASPTTGPTRPAPTRSDGRIRCWRGPSTGASGSAPPRAACPAWIRRAAGSTWRHQPGDPASLGENVVRCLGFGPQEPLGGAR